ncbi:MAG TPA: DUF5522 domain-containing protein [Pyrinomonadaceae bacterium]
MSEKSNPARINLSDYSLANSPETPLVPGEDFYIENGLYVFTAGYLRRRGYCCESGCRHCPYPKESNE